MSKIENEKAGQIKSTKRPCCYTSRLIFQSILAIKVERVILYI